MALQNSANLYPNSIDDVTIASGRSLWFDAGSADALVVAQDGTGQFVFKWNATRGGSETFQATGDPAMSLLLGSATLNGNYLLLRRSTAAGTAGAAITWENLLAVSGTGLTYKGSAIGVANIAQTWSAAQSFTGSHVIANNGIIRATAGVPSPGIYFQDQAAANQFAILYNATNNRLQLGVAGSNTAGELWSNNTNLIVNSGHLHVIRPYASGGAALRLGATTSPTIELVNLADNELNLNFGGAASGVLRNNSTKDATAYNADAALYVAGGAAIAKKLYAKELHSNDAISYALIPPSTQVLSYASARQLVLPANYSSTANGTANSNSAFVGATGFSVSEDFDPYGIASINGAPSFTIAVGLTGVWAISFGAVVTRGSGDLISNLGVGLRINGVTDYVRTALNTNTNSNAIIASQVTYSKMLSLTANDQVRPIFRVVSQNSTDVIVSAVDMSLQYLGR